MKKILFIILEGSSATGICVENVVSEFIRRNYSVDVITYENSTLQSAGGARNYCIKPKYFLRSKQTKTLFAIQCAVSSVLWWPWNSPLFTIKLFELARKLYEQNKYDVVIPCYTQIDSVIVCSILKNRFKQVTFIPYFLDSLSGGPVPRLLTKEKKIQKGLKWEEKLLRNADGIVAMQSSRQHHERYSQDRSYYSNMVFLDIPMLLPKIGNDSHAKVGTNKVKILTYVGSMPLSIRNPFYGLRILGDVPNVKVNIVAKIPDDLAYQEYCENSSHINLVGPVNHDEAVKYIAEADILINFGNRIAEMVPSKIFEYMSYGKPILSFSPNVNDPCIPYLRKYPLACIISENDDRENNVQNILSFLKNNNGKDFVTSEQLSKLFWENTPMCFCDYIEQMIEDDIHER